MSRYTDIDLLLNNYQTICNGVACMDCPFNDEGCRLEKMLLESPTADVVPVDIPTKQTNADRIRAMTDEELANFIGGIFTMERDVCGCYDPHTVITQTPRVEIRDFNDMIEWLKEKVPE